jgi:enoyl-CoA hydratase/carnithine racemase
VPNLSQIAPPGVGGIPAYNTEAARRAQVVANALAMAGRPVPAHIAELAGMPNKAVEAQWAQQKELYGQQLQAARDQWKSLDESQKAAVAAQNGLTKAGYESELRTREDNLKQGRWFNPQTGAFEAIPGAAEVAGGQAGAVATAQERARTS